MSEIQFSKKDVANTILLAGRILLQSGAETSRVEDTMFRMARSLGYKECQGYVINFLIHFTLDEDTKHKIVRIDQNSTNLFKIYQVNEISRKLVAGHISIQEADRMLRAMNTTLFDYPLWSKSLSAGIISFCFLYLQGGDFINVFTAVIAGIIGFIIVEMMKMKHTSLFIPELIGSMIVGSLSVLGHKLAPETQIGAIVIAGVMPIVPGVLITTAIQDLFGRHMLLFTAKFLEALVTSFAIGTGIAISLLIN